MEMSNLILIAGNARNVGKTTFGCQVVGQLANNHKVIAIKITPHFHLITNEQIFVAGHDAKWMIYREANPHSSKDSSRYLRAGATDVYYVQVANDSCLKPVAEWIITNLNTEEAIVCESAGLGQLIKPEIAYFIQGTTKEKEVNWHFKYNVIPSCNGRLISRRIKFLWMGKEYCIA
jgi:hypothetical protein